MKLWVDTTHCRSRAVCRSCRTSEKFRRKISESFDFDGVCPIGLEVGHAGDWPAIDRDAGQGGRHPLPVARAEGQRVACLEICEGCSDSRLGPDDSVVACQRIGSCGGAPACQRKFQTTLLLGSCPRALWPAIGPDLQP